MMGNCIERCKRTSSSVGPEVKSEEKNGKMQRIKIVLTKEELEWLMLQLNEKKNIEDVLGEIQRSRDTANWKPSLDSILETPDDDEPTGNIIS